MDEQSKKRWTEVKQGNPCSPDFGFWGVDQRNTDASGSFRNHLCQGRRTLSDAPGQVLTALWRSDPGTGRASTGGSRRCIRSFGLFLVNCCLHCSVSST